MLYRIKDRKSESWIHHDRLKLCEDRELHIWLKPQRNELLSETVENEEFDFTGLFEEDDAAMSASDPLMSHTGSDHDNASASDFLLGKQTMVKVPRVHQIFWCLEGPLTTMDYQRN